MNNPGTPATRLGGMASLLLTLMLCACGQAGQVEQSAVTVSDAYMFLPPPGRPMAAIYMQLHNNTDRDRRITQLETDIAGLAEVHRTVHEAGVARMRKVPEPLIPAGETLGLEPGGYHVMLMDMAPLAEGQQQFELRLTLDGDELLVADVQVRAR